jgi:hypothetical protein
LVCFIFKTIFLSKTVAIAEHQDTTYEPAPEYDKTGYFFYNIHPQIYAQHRAT